MKRIAKYLIIICAAALFCLLLIACNVDNGKQAVQLSAPSNLQIDGDILSWDEVENATGYEVCVGDEVYEVQSNSLDLFEITVIPADYQITVKAKGDGAEYTDSALSQALQYNVPIPQGLVFGLMEDGTYGVKAKDPSLVKGKIIIPSSINGKSVTQIPAEAFKDCTAMTALILPDTITVIGQYAFKGCANLQRIRLSSKLDVLETQVFYGCSNLKSVKVPEGVKNIKSGAFRECVSLKELYISGTVEDIHYSAFEGCSGLESIALEEGSSSYICEGNCLIKTVSEFSLVLGCKTSVIPPYVESIGKYAFQDCTGLTCLPEMPSSLKVINDYAFRGCTGLTEVTLPASVSQLGKGVFDSCTGLTEIKVDAANPVYKSQNNCLIRIADGAMLLGCKTSVIPDGVVSIEGAFDGCTGLTAVTVPQSVKIIGESAFASCRNLTEITLPSGLTAVGKYAFNLCTSLKSINIPYGVTEIGDNAFSYCVALTGIKIPESVTTIGREAFMYCSSIKGVTLPESVTTIGRDAFYDCTVYVSNLEFPAGWQYSHSMRSYWFYGGVILMGCTMEYEDGYPCVVAIDPYMARSTGLVSEYVVPYREGYTFGGWATEDGTVVAVPSLQSDKINYDGLGTFECDYLCITSEQFFKMWDYTTVYAVWIKN